MSIQREVSPFSGFSRFKEAAAVDDLPLPMVLLPAEGFKVLWANKSAKTLFGATAPEIGACLERLPAHVILYLVGAARNIDRLRGTQVHLQVRGGMLTLKLSLVPVNGDDDAERFWLVLEDVRDSVRADRWVSQYQDFVSTLRSQLPYPAWVVDEDDRLVDHNTAYLGELPVCQRAPAEISPCSERLRDECVCGVGAGLMAHSKSWRALAQTVRQKGSTETKELSLGSCGTWSVTMFPLPGGRACETYVGAFAVPKQGAAVQVIAPPTKQNRLHGSASDLQAVREQARATVAREIHDNLGQEMTILSLEVGRLNDHAQRAGVNGPLMQQLNTMQEHVMRIMKLMRTMVYDLRLDAVEEKGLARAAADYVVYYRQRTDLQGQLQVMEGWQDPAPEMAQHLYRSVQELLNNVAKHAEASRFVVRLGLDNSGYWLEVQDDGNGLPRKVLDGAGLRSLQERAAIYNGSVDVRTRPALHGTAVKLSLPTGSN
ncbi:histidine kinase [Paraburkholderia sp. EG287A]|uniref:sensor histidine kinase n=1 Tax=Paraburkholderia sp. EG287A TaxID=3237012 RepID=UPI0034D2517A